MVYNGKTYYQRRIIAILLEAVHTLTNKLIHEPSFKLKNASSQNRNDLLKAAEELYSLKGKSKKNK